MVGFCHGGNEPDGHDNDDDDDEHLGHVDLGEHPDQCDPHPIKTCSNFILQPPDNDFDDDDCDDNDDGDSVVVDDNDD